VADYHAWRRNYFPEDGVVMDAASRRDAEAFRDHFDDRLIELLARLKHDVPFHSPRYAGHMIAEQSLPGIAGYLAAMLYNPNNVSPDSAPVTIRLELEAAQMIARMLGHPSDGWAHLTSGGTVANIEALWLARSVKYLPLVVSGGAAHTRAQRRRRP
jgi:glutamate/tyrosine decarboxylase-like PLP-dependent enzyme